VPELPEVEAARRVVERAAVGRTIRTLLVMHPALERCISPEERHSLAGRRVTAVERRGKHQLIRLDDGRVLHVHFRMAGDWDVGRASDPPPRHARALFNFTDGDRVSLVDSRALCTLTLHDSAEAALPALGPEATDPSFTAERLGEALARRRGPIKPVLLDQRVVAGLGNIYAAEALWHARISPLAPASSLSSRRVERLLDGMRLALAAADADPGRYSRGDGVERLQVYGREGEPCERCSRAIRRVVQAGRSTFYCPHCQRR
jgi:formamidopyrimidine-DNA glycosylase